MTWIHFVSGRAPLAGDSNANLNGFSLWGTSLRRCETPLSIAAAAAALKRVFVTGFGPKREGNQRWKLGSQCHWMEIPYSNQRVKNWVEIIATKRWKRRKKHDKEFWPKGQSGSSSDGVKEVAESCLFLVTWLQQEITFEPEQFREERNPYPLYSRSLIHCAQIPA